MEHRNERDPAPTGGAALNRFGVEREGKRLWCTWPWQVFVLTCDGTVVCGCGDAFNQNRMGSAREETASEIWRGDGFRRMRRGMLDGSPVPFCQRCGLMQVHPGDFRPPDWPDAPEAYPKILYVEPSILCGIRCPQPACDPDRIHGTRSEKLLPFEILAKVVDELAPYLERVIFYNYGETFTNPDAARMIRYARERCPKAWIWTSTNGQHFDTPEKVAAIVESGVNEIQFSLDGATQTSYEKYRRGGNLAKALEGIRAIVGERERRGALYPAIVWNYILFDWNDSDAEMERARSMAIDLGVDRLTWATTDQPLGMPSRRFFPGSPDYERIRPGHIHGGRMIANAISWASRIEPLVLPRSARPGDLVEARYKVTNLGETTWAPPGKSAYREISLAVNLIEPGGKAVRECFLHRGLPHPVAPGESVEIELFGRALETPGRYVLKADIMRNGLWWLGDLGSEPVRSDFEIATGFEMPRAAVEALDPPRKVRASDGFEIRARVLNPSTHDLDGTGLLVGRAGLGIRWSAVSSGEVVRDGERLYFEPALRPRESRDLTIPVPPGALAPGTYRAKLDCVKEHTFWLEDFGFEPAVFDLEVEGPGETP